MSNYSTPTPSQLSPLAQKGLSLDTRQVDCSRGVMTNIDEWLRPSVYAKSLINFHQSTTGVFSSGGGGWVRDTANGLNSGAKVTGFGAYLDPIGAQYLLTQAGNTLYYYDTVGHAPTAIAGMGALSTSLLPTIRPSAPTTLTTTPFSIYTNGGVEPQKVYTVGAGAPTISATLGFSSGKFSTQISVSGMIPVTGAQVVLFVFCPQLAISPGIIQYTVQAGDTLVNVAQGLATATNSNPILTAAGFIALSSGTSITLSYPTTAVVTFSQWVKSEVISITGAPAAGNVVTFTANGIQASYTCIVGDTITTVAIALANAINTSTQPTLGFTAVASAATNAFVTVFYPRELTGVFSQTSTGGGAATLTLSVGLIETATLIGTLTAATAATITFTSAGITGSPVTVSYTQVAGDTVNSVAAQLYLTTNTNVNLTNAGIEPLVGGNIIMISSPTSLAPAVTYTSSSTAIHPVMTSGYPTALTATLLFTAGNTTPTWPGTFTGLQFTKPKFCEPFQARVAFSGFANTGISSNAIVQYVLISALGNAESFPLSVPPAATDAYAIPVPPILGAVTALRHHKLNTNNSSEVLVVGCQNGVCIISGSDATNYRLEILSDAHGIPSNNCFAQLDNALLYMATDGFRIYTGENNNSNLITDSQSMGIYDEFLNIDRATWQNSHCVHHRDTQEVWFWTPYTGNGGLPENAFIFQYNALGQDPIWYFINNTICTASIEFNHVFYGGNNAGLIQKWYGVKNYDDASGPGSPANVLPGSQIVLSLVGVGNPSQFCSINQVLVSTGFADQKFLMNAAAYEKMDDGSTRKQLQQPFNFVVQSRTRPQTVLGPASPQAWTLNFSAFPQQNSKFLDDYQPVGHGRFWEFSITCNDSSHNCDFTGLQATISIGGKRI